MKLGELVRDRVSLLRALPWGVLAPALVLTLIGCAFIYSASTDFDLVAQGGSGSTHPFKQLAFACLGGLLMLAIALSPQRWLSAGWLLALGLGLALLASVFVFGRTVNGAKSWIALGGGINIQPSELCKPLLVICLAGYLRFHRHIESLRTFLACLAITGAFMLPILMQPDFGTAMVFVPIVSSMVIIAGGRWYYVAGLVGSGLVGIPALYVLGMLKPHQMKRIDIYLSSLGGEVADQSGDGYQITQSLNAIGSGGLFGKGYGQGTQSQLAFLPERHTDFIFSVVAEEVGLVGVAVVLAVFFVMLERMLNVARDTREPFGRLLVVGIAAMFIGQLFVNIGMASGIMPITGLTLPFMSYGGSSLLCAFAALGLVCNVAVQPQRMMGRDVF